MKLVALLILTLGACSSKSSGFTSNVASVKLEAGQVSKLDGTPFTGTLVAKDKEIAALATNLLGDAVPRVSDADLVGLVVVLPVKGGLVEGTGVVHVDLHADKLNPEVARRSEEAIVLARARLGSIKIAEATFTHGRLNGTGTVWEPTGTGAPVKVAEARFVDGALHGPVIEYWPGTQAKKRELAFDHGVKTGPYRTFHANGKPASATTLVAGVPDGTVEAWYANGAPREKATYKDGNVVASQRWYPNGTRASEVAEGVEKRWYSNGQSMDEPPSGVLEEFHDNGTLRTRRHFADGVPHGLAEEFYDDGTKRAVETFERGTAHGRAQRWWKNGTLASDCTHAGGALDGPCKRWYANGKAWEEATYARGKRVGAYKKWWKDGKLAESSTFTPDGELDGDYKTFYDNGARWAVGKYTRGKAQGMLQRWFRDGKLGYRMMYDANGKPTGKHETWWPSGKPRLEATYVEGRLDGDFKNWLEDGTVYEIATFRRGNKLQTTRPPTN